MSTIPASNLVQVNPSVVGAGGDDLVLSGLLLTDSTRAPIGQVLAFPNDGQAVSDYFGPAADETKLATVYFNGFDNSTQKPASILFAQYPTADVGAYLRGGPVGELTLSELQAITPGTLSLVVNGTPYTSSSINLSSATSFSNAATIIAAAFTTPPFGVTYDSISKAFVVTTTAAGEDQTIAFPTTSAFSTAIYMTAARGAVLSQGADAATPGTFMDGVVAASQNWATFMTTFDPDNSGNTNKLAFAQWTAQQNDRYAYVAWDTDVTPTQSNDAVSSLGNIVDANGYSGTFPVYDPDNGPTIAAFVCGVGASIDFEAVNGRITFAYKGQSGLTAGVSDATAAANLIANGYNFYGAYATADSQFLFLQPGQVSGDYDWMDSYLDQIWLSNGLQVALLNLLSNARSIPYITSGYEMIQAACTDPINAALNCGVIRVGVPLSTQEAAQVNAAAGTKIDDVLTNFGYYLQVLPADPVVRVQRKSPPINLWYMDGQSVQQIVLNSALVQ